MPYCHKCRAKLRPNARLCHKCGAEVRAIPRGKITVLKESNASYEKFPSHALKLVEIVGEAVYSP